MPLPSRVLENVKRSIDRIEAFMKTDVRLSYLQWVAWWSILDSLYKAIGENPPERKYDNSSSK
jgi:hypothetical protein